MLQIFKTRILLLLCLIPVIQTKEARVVTTSKVEVYEGSLVVLPCYVSDASNLYNISVEWAKKSEYRKENIKVQPKQGSRTQGVSKLVHPKTDTDAHDLDLKWSTISIEQGSMKSS